MRKPGTHDDMVEIFTPYIRRNGKVIFPKSAKVFRFWVTRAKHEAYLRLRRKAS